MKELLMKIWKKEEGFSLIELIIVIAILAIIAAIAVPNLIGNIQDANEGADESNAKLIYDALSIAIAKNPNLAGTTTNTATVDFEVADAAVVHADCGTLVTEALKEFPNGAPSLKASTNSAVDAVFQFTKNGDLITIQNSSGTTIYTP